MKKLILILGLLLALPAMAETCENVMTQFAEEVTKAGMQEFGYHQMDEVTVVLEFASADKSYREALLITKHEGLESAFDKSVTVKGSGSCDYQGESFNYLRLSTDFGVQAEGSSTSIEGSKS